MYTADLQYVINLGESQTGSSMELCASSASQPRKSSAMTILIKEHEERIRKAEAAIAALKELKGWIV